MTKLPLSLAFSCLSYHASDSPWLKQMQLEDILGAIADYNCTLFINLCHVASDQPTIMKFIRCIHLEILLTHGLARPMEILWNYTTYMEIYVHLHHCLSQRSSIISG